MYGGFKPLRLCFNRAAHFFTNLPQHNASFENARPRSARHARGVVGRARGKRALAFCAGKLVQFFPARTRARTDNATGQREARPLRPVSITGLLRCSPYAREGQPVRAHARTGCQPAPARAFGAPRPTYGTASLTEGSNNT